MVNPLLLLVAAGSLHSVVLVQANRTLAEQKKQALAAPLR